MYRYVSSLILGKDTTSQWEEVDIGSLLTHAAYEQLRNFYLILTHPEREGRLYLDMSTVRVDAYNFQGSLRDWVANLGNRNLSFETEPPNHNDRHVLYVDPLTAGYTPNFADSTFNYREGDGRDLNDIKISRPQFLTSMESLYHNTLITVSGYIHDTTVINGEFFVLNGGKTVRATKNANFGMLAFQDVGGFTRKKIKYEDIGTFDNYSSMYSKLRFTVDEDLSDRAVFLVLGGYMVFLDEKFFIQNGPSSFMFSPEMYGIDERVIESYKALSLKDIGLNPLQFNDRAFDVDVLKSDAFLKRYFSMSQTFLVVMNSNKLHVNRTAVQRAGFPGQFLTHSEPRLPLIADKGKVIEYTKHEENGRWSAVCTDSYERNFVYTEGPRQRARVASDSLDVTRRYPHAHAYQLEITSKR